MLIIYGMNICSRTQESLKALESKKIPFEFRNFCESLTYLKEFLSYRDDPKYKSIFDPVRAAGAIGIPLFVTDTGLVTKSLDDALETIKP